MAQQHKIRLCGEADLVAIQEGRQSQYFVRIKALVKGASGYCDAERNVIHVPVSETVYRALHAQLTSCEEHRNPSLCVSGTLDLTVRASHLSMRTWDL